MPVRPKDEESSGDRQMVFRNRQTTEQTIEQVAEQVDDQDGQDDDHDQQDDENHHDQESEEPKGVGVRCVISR